MKPCQIKGKEKLNTTIEYVIASLKTGERSFVDMPSIGAFCKAADLGVASLTRELGRS